MSHRHLPALLGALALGLALLLAVGTPSQAEEGEAGHIVYLSVTGDGPNARAWFHGAPPAGTLVQEALDRFSADGYRVAEVRPYQRSVVRVLTEQSSLTPRTAEPDESFMILLQK
jgi:hypothetical protein